MIAVCAHHTNWGTVIFLCVVVVCVTAGYCVWRFTGGKHYDEKTLPDD